MNIQSLSFNDIKETVNNTVFNYAHKDRIAKIGLFGSFARGDVTDDSDLDFVIDFRYKHSEDTAELISEVERKYQFDEMLQNAFSPIELSIVTADGLIYAGSNFNKQLNKDVIWLYEQK